MLKFNSALACANKSAPLIVCSSVKVPFAATVLVTKFALGVDSTANLASPAGPANEPAMLKIYA